MILVPAIGLPLAFLNNPWMLGWLAAASAPIIIHLLSKRRYREVPWAAMQYLLAALKKNARRILIEQWLLLAVRTLLVILLVLAVAEPFLEHAGVSIGSGERTHKVLVVDGSFSMGYKPSDRSRFDRAKELAARIVDESSQGDGFTLVVMGAPPRVVVGTPAFEPRQFREEIDALRLPHAGGDLPATLEKVEEVLTAAHREHPRLAHAEVYFLTDLGRTSWAPELPSGAGDDFRARSQRLARSASLYVIDLGQGDSENMAVTHWEPVEPFATTSHALALEGEVRNFGRQPRFHQLVELFVDGRRAAEEYVDLEPDGRATVSFPYRFDSPGSHTAELRLAQDMLDVDNHRWLALEVKNKVRVLAIDGRPAGPGSAGATDYLVVALAPQREQTVQSALVVDVAPESAILEADLASYDCVFLADVAQFTGNEASVLRAYLERGGGLVFFLGEQVQADNYNRRLSGTSTDGPHVLPAVLVGRAPAGQHRFHPLAYQHVLVAPFRDQEQGGLLTAPVSEYFKLKLAENAPAKIALGFDSGDPAIVEEPIGRGRSVLVATSADTSWTALPVMGSYLPIVQELLALAVRGQLAEHNVLVGQPLGESLRNLGEQSLVQVRAPGGETTSVRLRPDGDWSTWSYPDTSQSGTYLATAGTSPVADAFAVNVDTAESDLAKLEPSDLRERIWAGVPFTLRNDWQDLSQETGEAIVRRNTLHQLLLAMVLGLLFLETLLAWLFGRRTV